MSNAALLVEDNSSHAELIGDELESVLPGWALDVAPTVAQARRRRAARSYGLFVLDYRLPDGDGIDLLREIRVADVDTPVLFVTTAASAKLAVEAMKLGADDYVVKEEGYLSILPVVVQEVLKRRRAAQEKRVLEERLQRARQGATLGYLASGLAHHINNPLATIRTFLQLLPTHFDDAEFRTGLYRRALAESERIRDLVRDFMRATTVPDGREIQHLEEILARAEDSVAGEVEAKGLVIRRKLPHPLPPIFVHGDAAMSLFLTLLQNAVRFSPAGATIDVRADVDETVGRLVTIVRDRGPGIPPEHRDKIFEPFFSTAAEGLGMGLFVAARIADLQDIQLSLEPAEGRGAAFRVGLPLARSATPSVAPNGTIEMAEAAAIAVRRLVAAH